MTDPHIPNDLGDFARDPGPNPGGRISAMATGLVGSEILRIAGEIRALVAGGQPVCDLTVGDFSSRHFPIPERLSADICDALRRGETNYPPSNGVPELRRAVGRFYARELGLLYPQEAVLIAGGARFLIYRLYLTFCDLPYRVVFPVRI